MVRLRRKKSPSKSRLKVRKKPPPEALAEKGTIRGEVKSAWGIVAGADVVVGSRSVVTDGTGKYEISALDAGVHSVSVRAPFPGYEAAPHNVTVAVGETKVVDVYLDFKKTIVEGHVYGVNGKPIANATLSGLLCGREIETSTSDDQGHFKFDRAKPGSQFVRVNAQGYAAESRNFTARDDGTTTLEFRLAPATCKVHGAVTDASGKPLLAEVFLSKSSVIVEKAWSDRETGRYVFPVLPGTYDLLANAAGYLSKGWRGSISADTNVDFTLAVLPKVSYEGM